MAAQSYDRLEGVIWYDGKLVPWQDANLHVLSHGLHYASAVFEGERAYGGQIFKSTEHSERLKRSAQILDFEIPYSVAEIDAAKKLVLEKNGKKEAYVRPVAWRGSEMMGVSAQNNTIHLAIASWEWPSYFDPEQRLKGIRLDLAEYRRPDPKTAPCRAKAAGLYMICTISKHRAERRGYADAMMLDWQGRVAECTGANIFFVKDGKIHTPLADCFLDGLTRQTVIALARKRGFEVIERRIMPDELTEFSECFITGSAAEVTAVSEIADWNFNPGGITKQLMDDYTAEVKPKGKPRRRDVSSRSFFDRDRIGGRLERPQQRHIAHAIARGEAVHVFVENAMPAFGGVPQQQRAVRREGDKADVEIIQVRLPRHEADDIAALQHSLVRQENRARDDAHGKSPLAQPLLRIDGLRELDRAVHADPLTKFVVDVALAPFEEIMVALAPVDDAVVIADLAQHGIEFARLAGDGRGQHGFAVGDAIEGVVAHDEFFRPARAADQRVAAVTRAAQRAGNKIDPL